MAETAKALIVNRALQDGYTDSYGTLLHLVAVMGLNPTELKPQTERELIEWGGHFEGLRAALHCLAMHEQSIDPELAAQVVHGQITDAIDVLKRGGAGTVG